MPGFLIWTEVPDENCLLCLYSLHLACNQKVLALGLYLEFLIPESIITT